MSRTRIAALAAVAVVGGILWWLFGTGVQAPAGGAATPLDRGADAALHHTESGSGGPSTDAKDIGPPAAPTTEAPGDQGEEGEASQRPVDKVHILAVLEDGTPLPYISIGDGDRMFLSQGDTTISRPTEPLFVRHFDADLVAAEGGEILPDDGKRDRRVRVDSNRLRLVFRDRPGLAHVRLVDGAKGEPIWDLEGLHESWEFPGGVLRVVLGRESLPFDGWIAVPEGKLPEAAGVDPQAIRVNLDKVTLVLALPGYEAARLPLREVRGRREVRVNPVEPDARGEVKEPKELLLKDLGEVVEVAQDRFIPDPGISLASAKIRSLDSPPQKVPEDLLGLPSRFGPFALYGLPDGAWEIEVMVQSNFGAAIRGKKAFERRGGTAEIGTIELKEGGVLRVKVVDAAGEAVPQAFVVAVRPDEDPDQGRPFFPDSDGRVVVADLEPGVDHRVQVRGLPRLLEQSARAAPAAEAKDVEFRWPEKAVPCRITLVVDGRVVANPDGSRTIPASVHESPLPRDRGSWGADGTFEARLVPGTYRFSAYATPKEGTGLALFAGEVTVPGGESFETRLELRREP